MSGIVRVIPALPAELDGRSIEWGRWELAPTLSHIDGGCDICDHPGPMSTAMGVTTERPWRRYFATRCRRCQVCRIITRQGPLFGGWVQVWESPGQAIGADL